MGINESEARHLMRRVGFGALPANVVTLTALDRVDAVDHALGASGAPLSTQVPAITTSLSRSEGRRILSDWWVGRMAGGAAPIVEKMVLFWHSHFACTIDRVKYMDLMRTQHLIFRQHALGDFHDLCQAVAIDPAMLIDLDNADNVAGEEQENFARELMELYTIGNGNFSEADVIAMARAWTGYGLTGEKENQRYQFHSQYHDYGTKTLFGASQNWTGPAAITALTRGVRQESTARFLCLKLWRYFGDPADVPNNLLDDLTQVMVANNMAIRPVVRAILLRDEFWDPTRRFGMVKPAIAWMAEMRRRTGVVLSASRLMSRSEDLGQQLFTPPSVTGWGHNGAWLSSTQMLARARVAEDMRSDVQESGWLAGVSTASPASCADTILDRFGVPDASSGTRQRLIEWATDAGDELNEKWFEREAFRVGALIPEVHLA